MPNNFARPQMPSSFHLSECKLVRADDKCLRELRRMADEMHLVSALELSWKFAFRVFLFG
jgi:hypothetical protein